MTEKHPFDDAIRLETIDASTMRGRTHPEWGNMVGPFGGITAAAMLHAIESHPDRIGEPLALTVNYAAPIADGDFDISLRTTRTNRTNQHWFVELSQGGDVKTTATAVFAVRRESWADTESRPPSAPPPEQVTASGPDGIVVWTLLYDMRFVEGPIPAEDDQPSPSSTTTLWVRDRAQRPVDYPALAALSDIFYPRVFLRRGGVVPSGTISLTTYFHADQHQLNGVGNDFVLCTAHANRFIRGYFDQSAQVWTRDGGLLATTHQVVYFKG
ncbi:acyl-CoA thioesterase [Mycobacterium nebraskense]|uniref:Acyl-CoA thioesterase n=1 Tax=Mycobacterium nebraskense TaxID=244292 RepID=A0A1X1Z8V4_9MYCO|nr:thioesterase family protein [Mycobacterium nebraskense]KKC04337.1 acyl-CoA thioesterase [Mycobacterium nebraskense]MBI2696204.1 thioesterase family protein [Mycobacterium nebraskense]MCV7117072.1 thioesterase family protein [Mycobacterium nebraskense]ORW19725.1 acyl-CoA thioesterase [Mycobacterium nebraskense]